MITCRFCGSHNVKIEAFDYLELEISCEDCGMTVDCGNYLPGKDYSDCVINKWRYPS